MIGLGEEYLFLGNLMHRVTLQEGVGEVGKEGGEGEEGEEGTGDEWNGTEEKKGPWDKRCMTVGVLLLLLIVCGAIIAIAMHRFSGQISWLRPRPETRLTSYYLFL